MTNEFKPKQQFEVYIHSRPLIKWYIAGINPSLQIMKNHLKLFLALICFTVSFTYGQSLKPAPQGFVIKGTVKNFTDTLWRFFYPGFLKNQVIEIHIAADGSFSKTIDITNTNDIGLYLGDVGIGIFAMPGDTLTLNWDYHNLKNTFKVKANSLVRQKEIDMMIDLAQYREPMMQMAKNARTSNTPDSVKLNQVNTFFAKQIQTVLKYPRTENWEKVLYDQYFEDKSLLKALELKGNDNKLLLDKPLTDSLMKHGIGAPPFSYLDNTLNEELFLKSNQYRDAIVDKVRQVSPFTSYSYQGTQRYGYEVNYTLRDCYAGMAFLYLSPLIRDWYLAQAIFSGYAHYKFELAEEAYTKFLPEIKTLTFKEELVAYHDNMVRTLKPGVPAPAFTLKDVNGKLVSLSDFKGKVVYIDFWGVNCGPCIYDIKNYSVALHQKYKDSNMVFLNICVDSNNAQWKKALSNLQIQGTNVIAEGWTANPVCKAYNINGIPHYILVDAKGNIANNNAPSMGQLQGDKNELDKLLVIK